MDISVNSDAMKDIIAKSIMDSLTPEKRDEILAKAVSSLLQPTSSYDKKTPLENAFNRAVSEVAHQIARDQIIGNTEIREKIVKLISDAWEKLTNDENHSQLVTKVSSALESALTGNRY